MEAAVGKCLEWKRQSFFFPLRPTVIEAQLNYIDCRDGSMSLPAHLQTPTLLLSPQLSISDGSFS